MKFACLISIALTGLSLPLQAALFSYSWSDNLANGGVIPDNDFNGWQDTRTISGFGYGSGLWQITDLNVTLNITGGFNGDLYGTLVHDSGFVVLLNHVGSTPGNPAGYSNPGLNIVLDQDAVTDVHAYGNVAGVVSGTYQPDGTASPATSLSSFNGLDPNGSWTLFLSDTSFGDGSQVLGWGLEITAVPEPVTVALGLFGLLWAGTVVALRLGRNGRTQGAGRTQT